ncbi:peroxiredoxin [Gymnodinialimonas sp. 57CJ19]|uniref:peroxiredoxin n=1 Tax=Gymnodinialimonas sp. 57CJ19 TaxID=3138498 RepID=UPI0031342E86
MLETGHPAPDFTLPRDGGTTLTLSDQRPKAVVLFFYPKDDTPGCTKEAIAFTGLESAFAEANTTLIGISKDTAAKHDKFIAKHDLSIALVSDTDHDTCEQYGTWVEKNMYGKKYMGIERATFLIDSDGNIAQIWRKVKVPGHAEAVLEAARAL